MLFRRDTYSVGILYFKGKERTDDEVLGNVQVSEQYRDFINSVGWAVSLLVMCILWAWEKAKLQDHLGYKVGLETTQQTGDYAPYYATFEYELIFHVAR